MTAPARWRTTSPSGVLLVALAAAMWGTDALFRRGLALELPAAVVVFGEHVLLVGCTVPLLLRGLRRAREHFRPRDWASVALIGAGASATATVLFTMAFAYGDPTTPLLLQKLQPLFAVVGARLLLGEAPLQRYVGYFAAAVAGAYLITFADPAALNWPAFAPALLAIGAAILWASGTVLGRALSAAIPPAELAAMRFGFGLPAAGLFVLLSGAHRSLPAVGAEDLVALVLLAAIPGLAALLLYYRGLQRTPASAATLAELAFPLSALVVNYLAFDASLTLTQWLGVAVLTGTITAMSLASRRGEAGLGIAVDHRSGSSVGSAAE